MDDSMASDPASTPSSNGEEEDTMEDTRRGPDSRFPPGFHFNPYDDELILYYLRRKIANMPLLYDVFNDVNLYEHHPQQLVENYEGWGANRWYFFTSRERKYPNGIRPNRKTDDGYWKATGVEKRILCNGEQIGVRKALVFYTGKAGRGEKTDWIMYEYINHDPSGLPRKPDGTMKLDDWVLCTIQKKRGADEGKRDQPEDKRDQPEDTRDQPSEAEQASTNQSSKKQKIAQVQQIQQDGREPPNYQVVQQIQQDDRMEQQIQQDGREVEPPLNYQVFQLIQQDGREVEPPLNYQVFQQIQHDDREVEPPLYYQVFRQIQQDDREVEPPLYYQVFRQIQQDGREVEPPLYYQVFGQIQQDGREVEPPLYYQVFRQIQHDGTQLYYQVCKQIQQHGKEVEPPLNYQVCPQIQQDGREVEPPNYQVCQKIQQDGREVEPLSQVIHQMGCYDSNANYNNYSVTQASAISSSNDFTGFMGPMDIGDYRPGDQNFQQNFPNPFTESNGLGCQPDQALDFEYENQQMICGPHYSSPTVMPVNECRCQEDTILAELRSFLGEQEIGVGLDNKDDMFSSQDGIVCQHSQDNHSNVNFINNSGKVKDSSSNKTKKGDV